MFSKQTKQTKAIFRYYKQCHTGLLQYENNDVGWMFTIFATNMNIIVFELSEYRHELSEYCLGTIWNIVWIRPIQALYANRPKTATNNCMCIGLNFVTSLFRCSLNIVTVYAELYPEAPQKDSLRTIGDCEWSWWVT